MNDIRERASFLSLLGGSDSGLTLINTDALVRKTEQQQRQIEYSNKVIDDLKRRIRELENSLERYKRRAEVAEEKLSPTWTRYLIEENEQLKDELEQVTLEKDALASQCSILEKRLDATKSEGAKEGEDAGKMSRVAKDAIEQRSGLDRMNSVFAANGLPFGGKEKASQPGSGTADGGSETGEDKPSFLKRLVEENEELKGRLELVSIENEDMAQECMILAEGIRCKQDEVMGLEDQIGKLEDFIAGMKNCDHEKARAVRVMANTEVTEKWKDNASLDDSFDFDSLSTSTIIGDYDVEEGANEEPDSKANDEEDYDSNSTCTIVGDEFNRSRADAEPKANEDHDGSSSSGIGWGLNRAKVAASSKVNDDGSDPSSAYSTKGQFDRRRLVGTPMVINEESDSDSGFNTKEEANKGAYVVNFKSTGEESDISSTSSTGWEFHRGQLITRFKANDDDSDSSSATSIPDESNKGRFGARINSHHSEQSSCSSLSSIADDSNKGRLAPKMKMKDSEEFNGSSSSTINDDFNKGKFAPKMKVKDSEESCGSSLSSIADDPNKGRLAPKMKMKDSEEFNGSSSSTITDDSNEGSFAPRGIASNEGSSCGNRGKACKGTLIAKLKANYEEYDSSTTSSVKGEVNRKISEADSLLPDESTACELTTKEKANRGALVAKLKANYEEHESGSAPIVKEEIKTGRVVGKLMANEALDVSTASMIKEEIKTGRVAAHAKAHGVTDGSTTSNIKVKVHKKNPDVTSISEDSDGVTAFKEVIKGRFVANFNASEESDSSSSSSNKGETNRGKIPIRSKASEVDSDSSTATTVKGKASRSRVPTRSKTAGEKQSDASIASTVKGGTSRSRVPTRSKTAVEKQSHANSAPGIKGKVNRGKSNVESSTDASESASGTSGERVNMLQTKAVINETSSCELEPKVEDKSIKGPNPDEMVTFLESMWSLLRNGGEEKEREDIGYFDKHPIPAVRHLIFNLVNNYKTLQTEKSEVKELVEFLELEGKCTMEELDDVKIANKKLEDDGKMMEKMCLDLEDKCLAMEEKCQALEYKCQTLQVTRIAHQSLEIKHRGLEDKYQSLKDTCQAMEDKCHNLQDECQVKAGKSQTSADKCKSLEVKCQALEKKCQKLQETCQKMEEKCCNLQGECQLREDKSQTSGDKCKYLETKCQTLEEKCQRLQETCQEMEDKCCNLQDDCQTKPGKSLTSGDKCKSLEAKCQASENKCHKLEETRQTLEKDFKKVELELHASVKKYQALESHSSSLEGQCQKLEEKTEALQIKLHAMEETRNLLETKCQGMEDKHKGKEGVSHAPDHESGDKQGQEEDQVSVDLSSSVEDNENHWALKCKALEEKCMELEKKCQDMSLTMAQFEGKCHKIGSICQNFEQKFIETGEEYSRLDEECSKLEGDNVRIEKTKSELAEKVNFWSHLCGKLYLYLGNDNTVDFSKLEDKFQKLGKAVNQEKSRKKQKLFVTTKGKVKRRQATKAPQMRTEKKSAIYEAMGGKNLDLQLQVTELQAEISKLKEEKEEFERAYKEEIGLSMRLSVEVEGLQSRLRFSEESLKGKMGDLEELVKEKRTVFEELERVRAKKKCLKKEVNELTGELEAMGETVAQSEKVIVDFMNSQDLVQRQIDMEVRQNEALEREIEKEVQIRAVYEKKLTSMHAEFNEMSDRLDQARERMEHSENVILTLQRMVEERSRRRSGRFRRWFSRFGR